MRGWPAQWALGALAASAFSLAALTHWSEPAIAAVAKALALLSVIAVWHCAREH